MRKRKIVYLLDYITFWNNKGDYGKERVRRMRERKRKRFEKWFERKKRRRYEPWWQDGKMVQWCEYPEGSICEWPCNGDC
jgi:hypothetical protein